MQNTQLHSLRHILVHSHVVNIVVDCGALGGWWSVKPGDGGVQNDVERRLRDDSTVGIVLQDSEGNESDEQT